MSLLYRVINCDAHIKRLVTFKKSAQLTGLTFTRVPCVNGKKFTPKKLCNMIKKGIIHKSADITPIEVAISLSHRKCWQDLVDSNASHMVVCEDDCRLRKAFKPMVKTVLKVLHPLQFLMVTNGNWSHTRSKRRKIKSFKVPGLTKRVDVYREMVPYTAGTGCYIIHRKFATMLLQRQLPIDTSVDLFMGGTLIKSKMHYTLDTIKDKSGCYTITPRLIYVNCPYEDSNLSTQNYSSRTIDQILCD